MINVKMLSFERKVINKPYEDNIYEAVAVFMDGKEIASAGVVIGGTEPAYVERIDVDEKYRGQGIGTWLLKKMAVEYDDIFISADNEDAARLYWRIGEEYTGESAYYVDYGYGVVIIKGYMVAADVAD